MRKRLIFTGIAEQIPYRIKGYVPLRIPF